MSELPSDLGQPPAGQESIDRRAWSRERQLRAVGIGAALIIVVVLGFWLGGRFLGKHAAPAGEPPPPAGTFRVTAQQMKTFTVESVAMHGFASEELTDGKIAVNGDRTTPLYSPYSGRVVRVIAGLGDTVKKGAPLATVEASEFVQAQNDLATAVAQLKLARINETRKHALYEAKGGSLQDWQQAQADLTAAETAVHSVRNRLRILGKSDEQIDALEAAHTIDAVAALTAPIAGVVVDRQVGPGQYLQAGSGTPVFTIADPSSVWLLANVREADSGSVHLGQLMEVHVPAYPKRAFDRAGDLCRGAGGSGDSPTAGQGGNRQSRRRAEAGDVREFSDHHQRHIGVSLHTRGGRRLRGRCRACVAGCRGGIARVPRHPHRSSRRRPGRGARRLEAG